MMCTPVVYLYSCTMFFFISTVVHTGCLFELLYTIVVYLYRGTILVFACDVVQTCCLFVLLYILAVFCVLFSKCNIYLY